MTTTDSETIGCGAFVFAGPPPSMTEDEFEFLAEYEQRKKKLEQDRKRQEELELLSQFVRFFRLLLACAAVPVEPHSY
jgi:hypothetical protein